ncbi:Nitroreductase family protein [uncultured archaeon]|nr:Nitroreductase family protein [uncultured archaeon]
MNKKILGIFVCALLVVPAAFLATGELNQTKTDDGIKNGTSTPLWYALPPPIVVNIVLEKSICRRMSVRTFTSELVTDQELSTILWAAYGYTENGNRSVFSPDKTYSTVLYVIRSDATYTYVPENHSLSLFKTGNYLDLGEYTAPIKFGLVWDTSISTDEQKGMAEIGMICQDIYFDANALDLATVTTGGGVDDLNQLGLPSNEKPEIIMPLGHPATPYNFTYSPLPVVNLPMVRNSTFSLADAINHRRIVTMWDTTPLSLVEQSQLIWSSYGVSYYIDNVNHKRHSTLPSAIDIYPFKIFAANQSGVYQYTPSTHSLTPMVQGDVREAIKNSLTVNNITVTSAPWIIIPCLDTNLGKSTYERFWYYEVGAIIHNVFLEAAALNLSANVLTDISDANSLRSALSISSKTNLVPWAVIPVGRPSSDHPPAKPDLSGPGSGNLGTRYNYTMSTTDPDGDAVSYWVDWGDNTNSGWVGVYTSGDTITVSHTWSKKGTYDIKGKAKDVDGAESSWATLNVKMPTSISFSFLMKFFARFPHIFLVLR